MNTNRRLKFLIDSISSILAHIYLKIGRYSRQASQPSRKLQSDPCREGWYVDFGQPHPIE